MKLGLCTLAALAALLAGCPDVTPGPVPPPPAPDASDAAPPSPEAGLPEAAAGPDASPAPEAGPPPSAVCSLACAALQAAGCPLGTKADCASFLDRDLAPGRIANAATGKALTCADLQKVKVAADAVKLGLVCR